MVVTLAPATDRSGVMQDRMARPSRCTVQAPHWPMPQPNLVPVRPSSSRMTQSSGESSGLRAVTVRPLSLKVVMGRSLLFLSAGSVGGGNRAASGGDLGFQIGPRGQLGARAAQIRCERRDLGVAQGGGVL